ncbi:MAG: histidinol-phosphatase [Bacteroidota bacterium]|nr:histidinol-phosphatase [Bacteroidota bacterium]
MSWTNYHSHCNYCDGAVPPANYAAEALAQGLKAYGFSSHVPLPFPARWSMKRENMENYLAEIKILRDIYQERGLQIYAGLEVDFIPDVIGPQSSFVQEAKLDYTVGSVHFVDAFPDGRPWEMDGPTTLFKEGLDQIFHNDIQALVRRYFGLTRQMVQEQCPDIIGHLDKIKMQNKPEFLFSEEADWYRAELLQTLDVIAAFGAIVEVNTRGLYQNKTVEVYPSRWVLKEMHQRQIPVTLSSDAHKPTEVARFFEQAAEVLQEVGYTHLRVLWNNTWQDLPFTLQGIQF